MPILKMNVEAGGPNMANFRATFQFLYDEGLGYIKDWKVNFSEGVIDLCTTASWFNENSPLNKKYKSRKNLFAELGLIQRPRRNKQDHDLITLNEDQLEKVSSFFNSFEYKSTIYEIVSLFKGSNPCGTNKHPEAAQIWEVDTENKYNINIFLRYFIQKTFPEFRVANKRQWLNQPTITLEVYLTLFNRINEVFNLFQHQNLNNQSIRIASQLARNLMRDCHIVDHDVSREVTNYEENIENRYLSMHEAYNRIFANNHQNINSNTDLERAHILPKWYIKRWMLVYINNQREYQLWKKMISDPLNFLPLDPNTHTAYDHSNGNMYWDLNGYLSNDGNINLDRFINFSKINESELTEQRKKYLNLYINNIHNHM